MLRIKWLCPACKQYCFKLIEPEMHRVPADWRVCSNCGHMGIDQVSSEEVTDIVTT